MGKLQRRGTMKREDSEVKGEATCKGKWASS